MTTGRSDRGPARPATAGSSAASDRATIEVNGIDLFRFEDFSNPAYKSLSTLLGACVPKQRYCQMDPSVLAKQIFPDHGDPAVLDIGCGSGKSRAMFHDINSQTHWRGIEIKETYNIADLDSLPSNVSIYDGVHIPFDDETFDFCYSKQVFEHVRHPEALLEEIRRVLKLGGAFFGSLSGGEPYHWHSLFNFTPLGWKTVVEENGFELTELYAGIDSLTLLLHHWSKNRKELGAYFRSSILNTALSKEGPKTPAGINYENTLKLAFAGHLVFRAKKA